MRKKMDLNYRIARFAKKGNTPEVIAKKVNKNVAFVNKALANPLTYIGVATAEEIGGKMPLKFVPAKLNPAMKVINSGTLLDMVNSPAHYTKGGIETYDFIVAKALSYDLGNVVKYVTRADHKGNRLEDLKKAQWYLAAAIKREEGK